MSRQKNEIYIKVISLLIVALILVQFFLHRVGLGEGVIATWLTIITQSYFFGFSFASLVVWAFLFSDTNRKKIWLFILSLAALTAGVMIIHHQAAHPTAALPLDLIGCVGFLFLLANCKNRTNITTLLVASCLAILPLLSSSFLATSYTVNPKTLDLYPYYFDCLLSTHVAPFLYFLTHKSLAAYILMAIPYMGLMAGYQVLAATQVKDGAVLTAPILLSLAGSLGYLVYFLFPVSGPIYIFGHLYPLHIQIISFSDAHPIYTNFAARNGMPSLHFAWAALLFINTTPERRKLRIAFGVYAALVTLSTMGLGEHYLTDLVAALPFIPLIQALTLIASRGIFRKYMLAAMRSFLIFTAFLVVLRWNPCSILSPLSAWIITLAIIIYSAIEIRSLNIFMDDPNDQFSLTHFQPSL